MATSINFQFKVNNKSFEFTAHEYMGNFSVCGTENNNVGQVFSGYIRDQRFKLQSSCKEIMYFEDQLIKSALKAYSQEVGFKIKYQ